MFLFLRNQLPCTQSLFWDDGYDTHDFTHFVSTLYLIVVYRFSLQELVRENQVCLICDTRPSSAAKSDTESIHYLWHHKYR